MSSSDYAAQFKAEWRIAYPQIKVDYPNARKMGSMTIDMGRMIDDHWPSAGLLSLDKPYLYGRFGWIYSREMRFLPDHSWYGKHFDEMGDLPERFYATRYLKGTTLTLASEWSGENYGHLVLDSLTRLAILEKLGGSVKDFDHIVLSKQKRGDISALLREFDLPVEKVFFIGDGDAVRVEKLVAPTFPGLRRIYPPWVVTYLRSKVSRAGGAKSAGRRIYVSRAGSARNAVNQEAVESLMHKYGFDIYDPGRSRNSRADFANAEFVIGLSGAGLADIAFCQPGTKILELIPTDHAYPYYYTLASAGSLNYGYLACNSVTNRVPDSWGPSNSDVLVPIDELERAMQLHGANLISAFSPARDLTS